MALHRYLVGNTVVMVATAATVDPLTEVQTLADPDSIVYTRVDSAGTETTYTWPSPHSPEVTHLAVGIFTCTVPVDVANGSRPREKWRFAFVLGGLEGAAEDAFDVDPSMVV